MSETCYTGGPEALQNNVNALEQLVGAKTFAAQREAVNKITSTLDNDFPTVTEENFKQAFADIIARETVTGGNPEVYKNALKIVSTKDKDGNYVKDAFALIQSVMLHQHAYTQGMQVSTHRVQGLAEQIANSKSKGLDEKQVKNLELEMIEAMAQLRNYMAHRSSIGSGLSFAFSQRQAKNVGTVTDSLNSYVESFSKNYKDAFEGDDFLQGLERNSKTRKVMEQEIKDLANDADISPHVQAAKDAVTETQADLDNYLKTREAGEEGATGKADEGASGGKKQVSTPQDRIDEIRSNDNWKSQEKNPILAVDKDGMVTIYRGGGPDVEISDGVWVTPDKNMAEKYAGEGVWGGEKSGGKVVELKVPASSLYRRQKGAGAGKERYVYVSGKKTTGKAGAKKKTEVDQTEVDLQAKVKAAKEDVTQLTRLKDLQDKVKVEEMDASALQAEIDRLKPAGGKSHSTLQRQLANLKKDGASKEKIDELTNQVKEARTAKNKREGLQKRLENLKNNNKDIAKVEAEIEQLKGKVDKIKELRKLEQTLARLKKPKSDIKKTKEEIEKIKKAREEEARRRIEASEITSETKYKKFINQTLGSRDARTLAKRLTFAEKMGKGEEATRNIAEAAKKSGFHKVLDAGLQWFTGSLLSGPPTFILNAVTPTISRTLQQLELATGALLTGNIPLFKASISMHNLFYGIGDAGNMAMAALKMDKDALLGGPRIFDDAGEEIGAFASSNFSKNAFLSSQPMAQVMDFLNVLTRLPNRLNGSADTFNKTMSSMQYLRTHFVAEAIAKKIPHGEVQQYVNKNVKKMFNKDGSLYSEARMMRSAIKQANDEGLSRADAVKFQQRVAAIMEKQINDIGMDKSDADVLSRTAEKFARESTFTDEPGAYTRLIKQGLNHMPVFKFLMPFVSTPMNILHFGWRRTLPGLGIEKLSPLIRKTADKRKKDWAELTPMQQAAERGRYATAVGFSGAMIYFATQNNDRITGGGPRNRKERNALMATGWRPYSFVFNNEDGSKTYVSYERVDPIATMISIIADAAEFTKMNPDDDDGFAEIFSALSFTIAENMTDKSFLRGVNNILNLTREPEVYLPKTFKDIGSAMAVPMFVDKLKNANGEQMIRETHTLKDAILRKVPIAEERVPPKRTFLGEAVYKQNPGGVLAMLNPIYIQSTKNDLVDEKIQGLLYGFSMPQTNWTKGKETDMREFYNADGRQAYDRMLELTSEHKIYGRTLRQSLKALFKSPAYKQAEQNFQQFGGGEGDTDPRVRLAKRVITRYRSVAKRLVIQEFPELQQTVKQVQQRNYQLRTGQSLNPIPSL